MNKFLILFLIIGNKLNGQIVIKDKIVTYNPLTKIYEYHYGFFRDSIDEYSLQGLPSMIEKRKKNQIDLSDYQSYFDTSYYMLPRPGEYEYCYNWGLHRGGDSWKIKINEDGKINDTAIVDFVNWSIMFNNFDSIISKYKTKEDKYECYNYYDLNETTIRSKYIFNKHKKLDSFISYYRTGKIEEIFLGIKKKKCRIGSFIQKIEFYKNDKIRFNNVNLNCQCNTWYYSGKLKSEYFYKNKKYIEYYENGNIKISYYKRLNQVFDENKNLIDLIIYKKNPNKKDNYYEENIWYSMNKNDTIRTIKFYGNHSIKEKLPDLKSTNFVERITFFENKEIEVNTTFDINSKGGDRFKKVIEIKHKNNTMQTQKIDYSTEKMIEILNK